MIISECPSIDSLAYPAENLQLSAIVGYTLSTNMADPCDICGDKGVIEAIITCCECKISRQHLYCMRVVTTEAPQFWVCEECEREKLFSPKASDKEEKHEACTQKVSSLIKKNTKSPNKNGFANRFNFKEKRVNTGRTKYITCEEAVKLSSGASKSEQQPLRNAFSSKHSSSKSMPPPREKSLTKIYGATKFEPQLQQPVVQKSIATKEKSDCLSPRKRADTTESIKSTKSFTKVEMPPTKEADVRRHIEVPKSSKKLEKNRTQESTKMAESKVSPPAKEEADVEVPKSLKEVEKTNMETGTGTTKEEADVESSGEPNLKRGESEIVSEIYYTSIPTFHSYWKYDKCTSLMEFLWSQNIVMKSYVDGVELLVLSSRFLQLDSQQFEGSYFLWGLFRKKMVQKSKSSSGQTGVVDNTGSKCADFPPGFEKIQKPPPGA
ncbi:hypothetical protein L2E82_26849 [Cichorium intybus]|uniref:Uncharacterized protein n=1 Tax=Cichorium intybus TaxID=13427 RepID=A0ACB9CRF7_CICIN|nr:hypothetical protein L2E82_26849 [Cichorium intybus]